ncbi:valine--tRNA ligase, partial [Candidatus Roizmanbacteria bacterium]|nr:valine--tRNA ligase [Candidatus Roizmanbacteria bacterium]
MKIMDKTFQPSKLEDDIYKSWEKNGLFRAKVNKKKKPFSIILPPPNANADLHMGHAMYVYEDVMIRYFKMKGYETLWLPGADHAGFETQFVFEQHLRRRRKSRFDFDRTTLFQMIWDFVSQNRGNMENQLRKLGFALDWTREKFTLDKDIVTIVHKTFKKLYDAGLVYRAYRLINYCTHCGTSFSDLEVEYKERKDALYYMKYGPFTLATVRPETKFGDTAVAVHPDDKRYKNRIGKQIEVEGLLGKFMMKVVGDTAVDPKFGTGVVKVTPAHDFNDFEIGKRHNLSLKQVIDFDGRLNEHTGKYKGLAVLEARKKVAQDLSDRGLLVKVKKDYRHRVGTCYRCGSILEPLPKEQWFIKVKPLVDASKKLVSSGKIKMYPVRFKTHLIRILEEFIDWNISRQIVWGIRIPAWRCKKCKEWTVTAGNAPTRCEKCGGGALEQDKDTFDTWFSSAQWPFVTLLTNGGKDFFNYFYPTSVMETGYDILRAWVARMIMIGQFVTGYEPFKTVFLHGMVRDERGQKMSKSKGNVINPMDMVEKHGADALRVALLFGVREGNDVVAAKEKIVGMRNFANKVWNIGRFI